MLISGCAYFTHLKEIKVLKSLGSSQQEMQVELAREEKLFNRLKTDINSGRLNKSIQKKKIFRIYGEPTLCKPAEGESSVKETCIYRRPAGGLSTEIILLNFDTQDMLYSLQVE